MDKQRAQEIASSPVMANVRYNDEQIYIQNVNEDQATIYSLKNPQHQMDVPVSELTEH